MRDMGTKLETTLSRTLPTCSKSWFGTPPRSSGGRATTSSRSFCQVLTSSRRSRSRRVFARLAKRVCLFSKTGPRSSPLALGWERKHRARPSLETFLGKRTPRCIRQRKPAETKSRRELGGSFIAVQRSTSNGSRRARPNCSYRFNKACSRVRDLAPAASGGIKKASASPLILRLSQPNLNSTDMRIIPRKRPSTRPKLSVQRTQLSLAGFQTVPQRRYLP